MGVANLADPQSMNLYIYVRNDPVNSVDPMGLKDRPASDDDERRTLRGGIHCSAQYSGEECGGLSGLMSGNYGDHVAEYNRVFGGMSEESVEALAKHLERIANSLKGKGFKTNEEIEQSKSSGGGGQQNPPKVAGADKDATNDFNNAFKEAETRLDDPDCAKLFGGKSAALTALYGANYGYAKLGAPTYDPNSGKVEVTGAATIDTLTPPRVYINTSGPFRNTNMLVLTPSGVQSKTVDFGTGLRGAQFGALILLHELGHLTKVFQPDASNSQFNQSQTDQVLKACFKETKKK
jgi:hypothetical protein